MTRRVWIGVLLVAALAAVSVRLAGGSGSSALRSEHSEPGATVPKDPVLIVEGGKVYHRPGCTFLHGEPKLVPAVDAVRLGYAPCVRCLAETLPR